MTKEALIKWYDSGAENRDEFITLVEQALAQQEPNPWSEAVTDQENEKFSMDVSTFSGADPEATKYALEQFLRNRAKEQPAQEPVVAHPIGFDYLDSGQLVATYALPVEGKNHPKLYTHPAPTQPALSDDEIWQFWCNRPEVPEGEDDSLEAEFVAACKRAIEAHCRGGK